MLSRCGEDLLAIQQMDLLEPQNEISFQFGSPAIEQFPMELWLKVLSGYCHHSPAWLNYTPDAARYFRLRVAIADYLGRSRLLSS